MSIRASGGKSSILQVMSDELVGRRLDAARENLATIEGTRVDEPANLVRLRDDMVRLQELVTRNDTRERALLSEIQQLSTRPAGVLAKVRAISSGDQPSNLSELKEHLGRVREGRARLQQEMTHAAFRIGEVERKWKLESNAAAIANVPRIEAARARVAQLEEAVRLLVRPTPENRELAYDLARTDFERALRARVSKASSVLPTASRDDRDVSFAMAARA